LDTYARPHHSLNPHLVVSIMSPAIWSECDSELRTEGPGKTIVMKIGTSSLIHPERDCVNVSALAKICEVVVDLQQQGRNAPNTRSCLRVPAAVVRRRILLTPCRTGHRVVIVTSGAVGVGCTRLNVKRTSVSSLAQKQALAAIGQVRHRPPHIAIVLQFFQSSIHRHLEHMWAACSV
jgi:hypothetical protein